MAAASRTDIGAAVCGVFFIVVLAVSAYWDPTIRVLHLFEAVPYVLAAALALRGRKEGYALGIAGGAFWLWCAGFLSTFVRNGFERLDVLVRTGSVDRPDILIAVPAAIAAGGLALFSALSYARARDKRGRDALLLGAALVVVAAYYLAIFRAFTPQYLEMFRRLFR